MSDETTQPTAGQTPPNTIPLRRDPAATRNGGGNGDGAPPADPLVALGDGDDDPPRRPRVYKLRIALILAGLGALAVVSTVFGMMMAVASDLPSLENRAEFKNARNSVLLDVNGKPLGTLTGNRNRILVGPTQISAAVEHAVIAIEDQRFYEHNGIDPKGIARALFADVFQRKAVQGASTIPQQFVKNALATQRKRTIFEKLREAALAYHLTRKWSKQKILTAYLNSIYFGNGAYGVESAAHVYFGFNHPGCGDQGQPTCASLLTPAEGALLAGVIASPAAWDPVAHPLASKRRRDTVLDKMLAQGYIARLDRDRSVAQPLPTASTIQLPKVDSKAPYFTSWVQSQVVDRFGPAKAFSGGLRVKTTLDVDLQQAAENAVSTHLSDPNGPAASMVVIDNRTGEVRAMVGGRPGKDYGQAPFNLATQGQRQPGSAFKAFVLAAALRQGVTPDSVWASQQKIFNVPNSGGKEKFVVNNFEGDYAGSRTLADATANSDNSVFAEVGIKVGTRRIARIAHEMGIRTPVSTNPAITLGGLKEGVTPLDMAHAYETLASGGQRVTGTLGSSQNGPVGIREVWDPIAHRTITNRPVTIKAVSRKLAETETEVLKGVVCCGTGKEASTGAFAAGKTGTTENFGDAWFVGFNKRWTVAVWVGYPDSLKPMRFDFGGSPVIGGSYPAQIWHDFILAADGIVDQRLTDKAAREGKTYTPDQSASSSGGTGGGGTDTTGGGGGSGSGGSGAGSGTGAGTRAPSGGGGTSRGAPSGGGGAPSGGGGGAPSGGGGGASGGTGAGGGSAAPTG